MAEEEAGGIASWTKLVGAVATLLTAVGGLIAIAHPGGSATAAAKSDSASGGASPQRPPEVAPTIPTDAANDAKAAYLALVEAYNKGDEAAYYAGFAEPMDCFYSKHGAHIDAERPTLTSDLRVSSSDLAPLAVQQDRVEFCDRGQWRTGADWKQHHKIIVMQKVDGRWLVKVETSSDQITCYASHFADRCR